MTASTFALVQLLAFLLAAAPLVIEGINHWTAGNRNNAILFATGVIVALVGVALGHVTYSALDLVFALGILVALLAAGVSRMAPGGVIKSCAALLPWFGIETWLTVFTAAMLIAALLGFAFKRSVLIAPPMVAVGAAALALPLVG